MFLLLLNAAMAATVYINGIRVDALPDAELKNVSVRMDSAGNVWIDAPNYRIQVADPTPSAPPSKAATAVAGGTWWLVTEDNASEGHTVDILVNGALVRRVKSGDPQLILDISAYLRKGTNQVVLQAQPGPQPSGGILKIYLGAGSNADGTVRLETPSVAYARRSTDAPTGETKQFTITVP